MSNQGFRKKICISVILKGFFFVLEEVERTNVNEYYDILCIEYYIITFSFFS